MNLSFHAWLIYKEEVEPGFLALLAYKDIEKIMKNSNWYADCA